MTLLANRAQRANRRGVACVAGRLGLALVIFPAGYLLIYRPRQVRWGATDQEVVRVMPGDAIQRQPSFKTTRAATIQTPPDQIWPWLMPIGYQRAGWDGYDWVDTDGMPSADRIIPQLQHLMQDTTIHLAATWKSR